MREGLPTGPGSENRKSSHLLDSLSPGCPPGPGEICSGVAMGSILGWFGQAGAAGSSRGAAEGVVRGGCGGPWVPTWGPWGLGGGRARPHTQPPPHPPFPSALEDRRRHRVLEA